MDIIVGFSIILVVFPLKREEGGFNSKMNHLEAVRDGVLGVLQKGA
jgi:hypothetical protein